MGQGASVSYLKDTVQLDTYLKEVTLAQHITGLALDKCVPGDFGQSATLTLDVEQKKCIREYTRMYASFAKSANGQFMHQYEQQQREMMERMRREHQAGAKH